MLLKGSYTLLLQAYSLSGQPGAAMTAYGKMKLAGLDINHRYIRLVRKRIFPRVIRLLRREFDLEAPDDGSLSLQEDELMLNLHGMVFFLGIRKWVYRVELPATTEQLIAQQIDLLLHGAHEILKGARDRGEPNAEA